MSSNKNARKELERLYGKECFIEKLHLRTGKKEHYTSKGQRERMKQLTYHHIKPKSQGGKATVENGALLSAENHAWFHKQSMQEQAKMNKSFQDYKLGVAVITDGKVEQCQALQFDDDYIEIPLETNKQRRARIKRETREAWEEYENER